MDADPPWHRCSFWRSRCFALDALPRARHRSSGGEEGLKLVNAQMSQELRPRRRVSGRRSISVELRTTRPASASPRGAHEDFKQLLVGLCRLPARTGFHRPPLRRGHVGLRARWRTTSTATRSRAGGRRAAWRSARIRRPDPHRPQPARGGRPISGNAGQLRAISRARGTSGSTVGSRCVNGVWHRDAGSQRAGTGTASASAAGRRSAASYSAWMGLPTSTATCTVRDRHQGKHNAFNEDRARCSTAATARSRPVDNDKAFPGYGIADGPDAVPRHRRRRQQLAPRSTSISGPTCRPTAAPPRQRGPAGSTPIRSA